MAANRRVKYFIFAIIILAGIAVVFSTRTRLSLSEKQDDAKFISTYVAITKAISQYAEQPDSLRLARLQIYKEKGTDSAWMANYARNLTGDLDKTSEIWDRIIIAIDTLKNIPLTDSTAGVF